MLRKTNFVPGNYYHIYNRGTEKREIFLDKSDYLRFIFLLYICNSVEPVNIRELFPEGFKKEIYKGLSFANLAKFNREKTLVNIGAYCLMPNHFHILIKEKIDNGISIFMRKLSTAYAMYFNKKNERNGVLFQGPFKAELVDNDEYLKYLFAYIHLNPVKLIEPAWRDQGIKNFKKAKEFLDNYRWSSYPAYVNGEENNPLLNKKSFPEYFCGTKEFKNFIEEWLKYENSKFP